MSSANQNQQSGGQSQASSSSSSSSSSGGKTGESAYRLPSNVCLQHSCKLAIVQDKPVMMDYWTASLDKSIIIGVRESGEKLLVKSEDEYTSPIAKIYKVDAEYIVETENSLYIVCASILSKRIS